MSAVQAQPLFDESYLFSNISDSERTAFAALDDELRANCFLYPIEQVKRLLATRASHTPSVPSAVKKALSPSSPKAGPLFGELKTMLSGLDKTQPQQPMPDTQPQRTKSAQPPKALDWRSVARAAAAKFNHKGGTVDLMAADYVNKCGDEVIPSDIVPTIVAEVERWQVAQYGRVVLGRASTQREVTDWATFWCWKHYRARRL